MKIYSILLFQLTLICSCGAQNVLRDANSGFQNISDNPQILHLKKNHLKIPSGGHLQGIQALSDSVFIITGSSSSYSYYLTANKSQLTGIYKISDAPYRHAGGCQVSGTELAVGVEDNQAKDKSQVVLISLVDSITRKQINPMIRRSGTFKRSTAGAVAMAKTDARAIIAVGAWDSRDIDFYSCRLDHPQFDSITTFHAPAGTKWCSYQSLNLLTDTAGKIYLIGFALDGISNRADLFEVTLHTDKADLKLLSTRTFKCRGGAGFRYGAGISIDKDNKLIIYACTRNAGARTTVNVFR